MSDLPAPEACKCGHRVRWFVPCDREQLPDWYGLDGKLETDVIDRPCPHRNGTMIEHCPSCDRKVGMWGFGVAGSMECSCWDHPWWKKLYWRTIGRLVARMDA